MARMGGVYLTTGMAIVLFLLQSRDLSLGQDDTLLGDLVLQCFQVVRKTGQTMAQRDTADPTGRDENPPFSVTRYWSGSGRGQGLCSKCKLK